MSAFTSDKTCCRVRSLPLRDRSGGRQAYARRPQANLACGRFSSCRLLLPSWQYFVAASVLLTGWIQERAGELEYDMFDISSTSQTTSVSKRNAIVNFHWSYPEQCMGVWQVAKKLSQGKVFGPKKKKGIQTKTTITTAKTPLSPN